MDHLWPKSQEFENPRMCNPADRKISNWSKHGQKRSILKKGYLKKCLKNRDFFHFPLHFALPGANGV